MTNKRVLITGATGVLGSWVLGEALVRGYEPIVLMRDAQQERARERVAAVLQLVDRGCDVERVGLVFGNTCAPSFGLKPLELSELRSTVGAVIHCAACTSFSTRQNQEVWDTNVGGMTHILEFLDGAEIPLFHVSTAYVAGKRKGTVYETELDVDQEFNNDYERSKCESEKRLCAAIESERVQAAVFRPSIIVGATHQGRVTQFLNFYNFLRLVDYVVNNLRNGHRRLRMRANPLATKNLVPVDWTAQAMWDIIETEGASGHVYHLTNPNPITMQELLEWGTVSVLNGSSLKVEYVDRIGRDATSLEAVAHRSFRLYRPYLLDEPSFDRTNTDRALDGARPFPAVTPELLDTLLSFAREQEWQSIFEYKPVAA